MSLENKQGNKGCICAALWGMMEWIGAKQERRGSSCLLCAIFGLPEDGWCGRETHCVVDTRRLIHECVHEYRHVFECTPANKQDQRADESKNGNSRSLASHEYAAVTLV